jgi:hypothetical protein
MPLGDQCVRLVDEAFQDTRIDTGTLDALRPAPVRMTGLVDRHGCGQHASVEIEELEVLEVAGTVLGVRGKHLLAHRAPAAM